MLISSVRKISNVNSQKTTGLFFSHKMRSNLAWESTLERDWLFHLEYNRAVLDIKCQTVLLYDVCAGGDRQYTPDFCTLERNVERPVFYEVKPWNVVDSKTFSKERRRYEAAVYQNGGVLRIVTEKEIHREPMFSNLQLLYAYAKVPPLLPANQLALLQFMRDSPNPTIAELVTAGRNFNFGVSQIRRELFCGCLHMSLEFPLNANSRVTLWESNHG